jgi:sugar phosphate isomerase/epimerase
MRSNSTQFLPMHFAICNEIFKDWPLDRACAFVRSAGYDAMEIAPFTFSPLVTDVSAQHRLQIRRTAEAAGLKISGIHWVLAYTEGFYVNHPDPSVRKRTSDYLKAAVDFCGDLGGEFVIFGSPKRRDLLPGVSYPDGVKWTLDSFSPAVDRATERGVTICMEPLGPAESNFLNTAAEAIALVDQLPSPHFKIMLDVKAMCTESKPIPEVIRDSAGKFAYLHANDRNLKGPGFGEVDFLPIGQALHEVHYDGYVSVEVFNFDEGAEAIAVQSRQYLRRCFGC